MPTTPTVLDVAKYVLETVGRPMTTMKLQKLVYYCQAWHLAWGRGAMFPGHFQAWANGPVHYGLYSQHRGKYSIDAAYLTAGDSGRLSAEQQVHVRAVLAAYNPLSAAQLSELTHSEAPWLEARQGVAPGEISAAPINNDTMQAYYAALADDPNAVPVTELSALA